VCLGLLVATAAVPVAWSVRRLAGGVTLIGDLAVFDLRVRDVGTAHTPLVGLYSRFGWSHPGPVAFYCAAPFRVLLGPTVGLTAFAAAWNVASVALVAALARRRGGPVVVMAALAVQLATWVSVGGESTTLAWTPLLALSLVVPTLLASWGTACGDRTAALVAAVLTVVVVQVHVGYAAVTVAPLIAGVLLGRRRGLDLGFARRAALIVALLSTPVALDALRNPPGNAASIVRFLVEAPYPRQGLRFALGALAHEVRPVPEWVLGPARAVDPFGAARTGPAWLLAGVVLLGGLAAAVSGRRGRSARALLTVTGVAAVAGTMALAQVRGRAYSYLVLWRAPLVVALVVACAAVIAAVAGPRRQIGGSAGRRAPAALALTLVGWPLAGALATGTDIAAVNGGQETVRALLRSIDPIGPDGAQLRLGDTSFCGVLAGLLHALHGRGEDVGVHPSSEVFSDRHTVATRDVERVWIITESTVATALWSAQDGARVVASTGTLAPRAATRLHARQREVAAALRAAGRVDLIETLDGPYAALAVAGVPGVDTAALEEIARLQAGHSACDHGAVIEFARGRVPRPWWGGPDAAA
jgi:hypothetical protein